MAATTTKTDYNYVTTEIKDINSRIIDLTNNLGNLCATCNERHKQDFYTEISLIKLAHEHLETKCKDLVKDYDNIFQSFNQLNSKHIELTGQLNYLRMKVDELVDHNSQTKTKRSEMVRNIIVLLIGSLFIPIVVWVIISFIEHYQELANSAISNNNDTTSEVGYNMTDVPNILCYDNTYNDYNILESNSG